MDQITVITLKMLEQVVEVRLKLTNILLMSFFVQVKSLQRVLMATLNCIVRTTLDHLMMDWLFIVITVDGLGSVMMVGPVIMLDSYARS